MLKCLNQVPCRRVSTIINKMGPIVGDLYRPGPGLVPPGHRGAQQQTFAKFHSARTKPLLEPCPCWKYLLALSQLSANIIKDRSMVIKDAYSCPSVIEDKLDKCPNFTSMYLQCLNTRLAKCLDRVLIVEALAGAFNREKVPGPEHCETSRRFIDSSTPLVTAEKRSSGVSPVIVSDFRGVVNS